MVKVAAAAGRHLRAAQPEAGLTKTAMDPLSMVGLAAAGHVGMNAGVKGMRWLARGKGAIAQKARNMLPNSWRKHITTAGDRAMADGISAGVSGAKPTFGRRVVENWGAPEVYAYNHAGEAIGAGVAAARANAAGVVSKPTRGTIRNRLKKIRSAVARNPELHDAHTTHSIVPGINRMLDQGVPARLPPLTAGGRVLDKLKSAGALAVGAPLVAAEPGALIHAAGNRTRVAIANSRMGANYAESQARRGAAAAGAEVAKAHNIVNTAKPPSKAMQSVKDAATDYLLSPMARDPAVAAGAVVRAAGSASGNGRRLLGAFDAVSPDARNMVMRDNKVRGALWLAPKPAAPAPVASPELTRRLAEYRSRS